MKRILLNTIIAAALTAPLTGCLEEAFPEDGKMTGPQIANADISKLAAAIPAYMLYYGESNYYDIGFAADMIWRDAMTADLPYFKLGYDYFTNFNYQLVIGNNGPATLMWQRYYYLLQKCNSVIAATGYDIAPDSYEAPYAGTALVYRAMAYLDLSREFEYKRTGVAALDQIAEERSLWGLTVPLITETTTEAESRHTPRLPFEQMYRFILNDLSQAESILAETHSASAKNYACLGLVYGYQARVWLELGSRCLNNAADVEKMKASDNSAEFTELVKFDIASANDCFAKASECARKAIGEGFTPVTFGEWYNPSSGFNTPTNAWMQAMLISPDNDLAKYCTWKSWVSFMSPEANYGIASNDYENYKCIDARLFSQMDPNDWRRDTWVAPGDSASLTAYNEKYAKATSMTFDEFSVFGTYGGFKYHPAGGDRNTAANGNAVAIPMMRVEEMWLIDAEASAYIDPALGKQKLENFMNAYRMKEGTTYECPLSSLVGVVDAIWTQKRIEFWGEGLVYWDYKRRNLAIVRGYPGTNHPEVYRYNSYPDACAPWLNFYIPDRSHNLNDLVVLNPDPSGAIPDLWKP